MEKPTKVEVGQRYKAGKLSHFPEQLIVVTEVSAARIAYAYEAGSLFGQKFTRRTDEFRELTGPLVGGPQASEPATPRKMSKGMRLRGRLFNRVEGTVAQADATFTVSHPCLSVNGAWWAEEDAYIALESEPYAVARPSPATPVEAPPRETCACGKRGTVFVTAVWMCPTCAGREGRYS